MSEKSETKEPAGDFTDDWKSSTGCTCPKCVGAACQYRSWESSDGGHEDYQYRCLDCGHRWWIDGADA